MEQSDPRSSTVISSIGDTVSRYVSLLMEDTRLSLAEKLTRLLSKLTICALLLVLSLSTLLFLSIAAGIALSRIMEPMWAYVVVASLYVVLGVIVVFCKNSLIVNPIARFISRLLVNAPEKPSTSNDKSASVSTDA